MTADTDKLLSLARECGGVIEADEAPGWEVTYVTFSTNTLAALEQRIRLDERERCAVICEEQPRMTDSLDGQSFYIATGQCARAIRSTAGASHG